MYSGSLCTRAEQIFLHFSRSSQFGFGLGHRFFQHHSERDGGESAIDALILSGKTGGGHNAAARAMQEALERRGHNAVLLDPYDLAKGHVGETVGNAYINLVRKAPWGFAALYYMGSAYRRLPIHSPVYLVNLRMVRLMRAYMESHHYDVIICTHFFPAEILSALKARGMKLPPVFLINTDYVCVPFAEEVYCDYSIIASDRLTEEFSSYGIAREKILPLGIPVRAEFSQPADREELLRQMDLDPAKRYILLVGGSFGAGNIRGAAKQLEAFLDDHPGYVLIIICGTNQELYRKLSDQYQADDRVIVMQSTDRPEDYLKVCDALITKPGGLLSTEAAVSGTPIIHISPLPGVEPNNMRFFSQNGLSVKVGKHLKNLDPALEKLLEPENTAEMIRAQKKEINPRAGEDICSYVENFLEKENCG